MKYFIKTKPIQRWVFNSHLNTNIKRWHYIAPCYIPWASWWLRWYRIYLLMQETQEAPVSILGSGRSPGEENGHPRQDSSLGNPTDRGAWQATVRGVTKSQTSPHDSTAHVGSQHTHIYVQIECNIMLNVTKCSLVTNTTVAETTLISGCLWSHLFQYNLEMTLHYVRMYCILCYLRGSFDKLINLSFI